MTTEQATTQHTGKVLTGRVVSNAMDKTVVVEVQRYVKHPRYHKYIKIRKRYKAHDPENACNVGDHVRIRETKPIAKHKMFEVTA